MLTPLDIQNKVFKKSINGYDKADVDSYIDLIIADYEKAYTSSIEANDKINALSRLVDSYKAMEETMKNSIIVAQNAADEVTSNAKEKADIIIDEANLKAQKIVAEAEDKIKDLTQKFSELKTSVDMYKSQAIGMFEAQIDVIKKFGDKE